MVYGAHYDALSKGGRGKWHLEGIVKGMKHNKYWNKFWKLCHNNKNLKMLKILKEKNK